MPIQSIRTALLFCVNVHREMEPHSVIVDLTSYTRVERGTWMMLLQGKCIVLFKPCNDCMEDT